MVRRLGPTTATILLLLVFIPPLAYAQSAASDSARNQPGDFVINRPAGLYAKPSAEAQIVRRLRPHTIVKVVEVLDQWYKVQSTTGREDGYIRRSYADPFRGRAGGTAAQGKRFRVGTFKLVDPVVVREQPDMSSRKLATLKAGVEVHVVDKDPSGLWYKIESETGNRPPGWIPTQAAKRLDASR
jgi:SH3-like domain-containing protein